MLKSEITQTRASAQETSETERVGHGHSHHYHWSESIIVAVLLTQLLSVEHEQACCEVVVVNER